MPNIEFGVGAQELDKLVNTMGKIDKATLKAAISAVGLGKNLDKSAKKGKKNVSELEKGVKQLGSKLITLAGPASIFGGFMAAAKMNFDQMIKMADKAKTQNASFSKSKASLFTNDRLFKDDKNLQKEFDNFFKEQGKRSTGVLDALPLALAGARSKTAALDITKNGQFLKAASESAVNAYVATQGGSNIESDIVAISQIAERDKRDVSVQQKAISAEAQKAQFQGQSAGDAQTAAAIIPKILASAVNFGSKEEILATQSFATNQGLTQEAAASGISQLNTKLRKHEKFKDFKGTGFELLLKAGEMLKSGNLNSTEFSGNESPIINAISKNPQNLNTFVKELNQARNVKTSASADNLKAQIEEDPNLQKNIEARQKKGQSEVAAVQDGDGSDFSNELDIGKSKLETAGSSGVEQFLTSTATKAGKFFGLASNKDVENQYDETYLRTLSGDTYSKNILSSVTGNPLLNPLSSFKTFNSLTKSKEQLAGDIKSGTLSGELVNVADGDFTKTEKERLRFSGVSEEGISELSRQAKDDASKAQQLLEAVLEELRKANEQRTEGNQDRKQQATKSTPGEDDI